MKSLIIAFSLLSILSCLKAQTQNITGEWDYKAMQMSFVFHPVQENGYGTYEVTYSNGYQYQDYYQLENQQLGLARFNQGQDVYYQIVSQDANNLLLQDASFNQYPLSRKAGPIVLENSELFNQARYPIHSEEVLSISNEQKLTKGNLYQNLRFLEFLLNAEITDTEFKKFRKDCIKEFQKSPETFLQETKEVDSQMQQLYQLNDPVQIALAQSALLSQIYPLMKNNPEAESFIRLLNKYNKVLAYDQTNMLAITEQDIDAFIQMSNFFNQLRGLNIDFSEKEKKQMMKEASQNFHNLPLDHKQSLCALDAMYDYIYGNYMRMTEVDKALFQNQLRGTQQKDSTYASTTGSSDFQKGTSSHLDYLQEKLDRTGQLNQAEIEEYKRHRQANQNMFTMMQNIQTQSHVTSMNIIENMGDSGNYWEVKYDY